MSKPAKPMFRAVLAGIVTKPEEPPVQIYGFSRVEIDLWAQNVLKQYPRKLCPNARIDVYECKETRVASLVIVEEEKPSKIGESTAHLENIQGQANG